MLFSLLCLHTVTHAEYTQYEADDGDSQYDSQASDEAYQREQAQRDAEDAEARDNARHQWIHQQAVEAHRQEMQAMREQREAQRQKIVDNVMAHAREQKEEAERLKNFPGYNGNNSLVPYYSNTTALPAQPASTVAHPWVVVVVFLMLLTAALWWWLDRQKTNVDSTRKRSARGRNTP